MPSDDLVDDLRLTLDPTLIKHKTDTMDSSLAEFLKENVDDKFM
jgi:hypothetical protein